MHRLQVVRSSNVVSFRSHSRLGALRTRCLGNCRCKFSNSRLLSLQPSSYHSVSRTISKNDKNRRKEIYYDPDPFHASGWHWKSAHDSHSYPKRSDFWRYFSTTGQQNELEEEEDDDDDDELEADNNKNQDADEISRQRKRKKRRALHRVSLQSVPFWLKREPYCFERTVEALDLNMSSERWKVTGSSSATQFDDLQGQYRKAFNDSIPSFIEHLNSSEELPEYVEEALDRLVEAGFSDQEFSKTYRSVKSNQLIHAQTTAQLQEKERAHQQRKAVVQEIQSKIDEIEQELERLKTQKEVYVKEHLPSIENKKVHDPDIIDVFLSYLKTSDTRSNQDQADQKTAMIAHEMLQLEQKIQRLQRQIDGRKKHIESHQQGLQNTEATIETLKEQQLAHRSPMSTEVYERTQQTIYEVMLVLCDALADHIQKRHSSLLEHYRNLDSKTDLTKPHEWYLLARLDKRKIIYHGGPTNSGKTYNALQRLKTANRGLYLGPLRLLAAEIYENLNAQGVYCNLITGQERSDIPFATHAAATVEMAANLLDEEYDVVVIDEIQMMSDKDRGFAWTRALMGIRCKEIHVCGGLEAKDLVQKIAEACNDDFHLNQYERFSTLSVAPRSLAVHPEEVGCYKRVQPADCIVAFSRNDIFAIKREIEAQTPYKCCVIYGTLPPQTRTTQARLFNDPGSGYDILVASDAISMGLNLNIRRIIFNSLYKNDGEDIVRLDHSAVKQIAGRAGRRNSPFPEGEATCRDPRDLPYLTECLKTPIPPIEKAGLVPTSEHIELFGEALSPDNGHSKQLHTLVKEFSEMAVVKGDFFLCRQSSMYLISKWLANIPLEINDKYQFCMAPVATNNPKGKDVIVSYAQKLAAGEVAGLTRGGIMKRAESFIELANLCGIYSEVELFIWLQNKFPPINLMEQQAALARKENAASFINLGLQEAEKLKLDHCYIKRDANLRARWMQVQQESGDDTEMDDDSDDNEKEYEVERL